MRGSPHLSPSASPCGIRAKPHGFSSEVIRHLWWLASPTMRIPSGGAGLLIPGPATGTGSLPPYYIQLFTETKMLKRTEGNIYSTSQRRANDSVAIISLPHLPNSAWSGSFIMLNSCNSSHSLLFKTSMPLYLQSSVYEPHLPFFFWFTLSKFQFRHHLLLPHIPK